MRIGLLFTVALTSAASVAPQTALAFEDDVTFDLCAGYAHANPQPEHGLFLGAGASFGISDALTLRGHALGALYPSNRTSIQLGAELIYILDILAVVPFGGVGLGGMFNITPGLRTTATRLDFLPYAIVGLDWLVSRSLVLGLDARLMFNVTNWDTDSMILQVGARVSWILSS